jgi:hypothetical protein
MKFFAVLVATCALCQTAIAQTPGCKSISNPGARLACYDKAAAPAASSVIAKPPLRAVPVAKADDGGNYVDSIGAEDARVNAKLKNICRGC